MKHARFAFLDTAYIYALINTRDQWHERAVVWQERLAKEKRQLVSTEFVLLEIADGLAAVQFHKHAVQIINLLKENPFNRIFPSKNDNSQFEIINGILYKHHKIIININIHG